jgi:putative membrane protein
MRLSDEDRTRVAAAVTAAESETDGEIVTVLSGRSDAYHDVALHWTILAMLLVLALLAWDPRPVEWLHAQFVDSWAESVPPRWYLTFALLLMAVTFLVVRLVLALDALRLMLTPPATKARRVRRRALALFHIGAEKRTRGATGVLLYVSVAERRAELIADEAIHSKVPNEVWGDAMHALVAAVRHGRPADGLVDAVAQVGKVLAQHFPRSADDTNELPDRLIEL